MIAAVDISGSATAARKASLGRTRNRAPKPWMVERTAEVLKAFKRIEARGQRGDCIKRVIPLVAWQLRQRGFKTAPERPFRISGSRLAVLYYTWRGQGRNPAMLALAYRTGGDQIPAAFVKEFVRRCARPDAPSRRAVFAEIVSDWQRGKLVAGFGTYRQFLLRRNRLQRVPAAAPKFPVSFPALSRHFSDTDFKRLRALRQAATIAERDLLQEVNTLVARAGKN
ncbi:MAG: hypothetical protein HY043_22785 [Verrucomicrobia bacterium]|nr:hypothetical protein [Verrucomicrobiota bacterium]